VEKIKTHYYRYARCYKCQYFDRRLYTFADDTQLYLRSRRDDTMSTVHRLERCITDVGLCMLDNRLKLNTEKTELLLAGSRHGQSSLTGCGPSLQLGTDTVTAHDDVRLLGVTLSSGLSVQRHVSSASATSFYWLPDVSDVHLSPSRRPHSSTRS